VTTPALEQLAARLDQATPALVVLEATGGFEITVAAALCGAEAAACGAQPAADPEFRPGLRPSCQDRRPRRPDDGAVAERIRPEPRPLADAQAQRLAELVARRRQIVEMIGAESNRRRQAQIHACNATSTPKSWPRAGEAASAAGGPSGPALPPHSAQDYSSPSN
jgi:transposase